ncbi:MAG TPA: hypothetical protein VMY76_02515 [Gemmatimonadales bacterium]|nr:hypothetical protein [Gemmatimonadales bacterium]
MASEADYSRAALARFIEFVVDKNLVHPATAQGWRVATTKVLADIPPEGTADVRRIDVDVTFRAFLHRTPGRLSPASVGEYRRRVSRAIDEFVRWVEDPGNYAFRGSGRARGEARRRAQASPADIPAADRPTSIVPPQNASGSGGRSSADIRFPLPRGGISLEYPLRPDVLAQVVVPRDLTVEEARRMGAFLVTLAVDFRPAHPVEA